MVKKIISFVLLFLLIISFTLSIIISILYFTIFNESYIVSVIEDNSYYSKTYNNIIEKFKDNTIQSGLDESVLEGIITEKKVEEDTKNIIKNIYENTETKVDTEITKTRLKEKIDQIIKNNNKKVTNEEQESINIYLNTIEKIYEDGILYKQNYIEMVQSVFSKIIKICPIIMVVSFGITLILAIIIVIINKKESIEYYSVLFISSGILLVIPKLIEAIHINMHNILLFNLNFSKVVINVVENAVDSFMVCGIICIVLGLGMEIVTVLISTKVGGKKIED